MMGGRKGRLCPPGCALLRNSWLWCIGLHQQQDTIFLRSHCVPKVRIFGQCLNDNLFCPVPQSWWIFQLELFSAQVSIYDNCESGEYVSHVDLSGSATWGKVGAVWNWSGMLGKISSFSEHNFLPFAPRGELVLCNKWDVIWQIWSFLNKYFGFVANNLFLDVYTSLCT